MKERSNHRLTHHGLRYAAEYSQHTDENKTYGDGRSHPAATRNWNALGIAHSCTHFPPTFLIMKNSVFAIMEPQFGLFFHSPPQIFKLLSCKLQFSCFLISFLKAFFKHSSLIIGSSNKFYSEIGNTVAIGNIHAGLTFYLTSTKAKEVLKRKTTLPCKCKILIAPMCRSMASDVKFCALLY